VDNWIHMCISVASAGTYISKFNIFHSLHRGFNKTHT